MTIEELRKKYNDEIDSYVYPKDLKLFSRNAKAIVERAIDEAAKIGNGLEELNKNKKNKELFFNVVESEITNWQADKIGWKTFKERLFDELCNIFDTRKPEIDREKLISSIKDITRCENYINDGDITIEDIADEIINSDIWKGYN